jgi:hypothetical protein
VATDPLPGFKSKKGGTTCIVLKKGSSDSKGTSKGMLGLQ